MEKTGTYRYINGRIEKVSDAIPRLGTPAFFKETYFSENLTDKEHPNGQPVLSKSHKIELMKKQGLAEV
jgi:hypothetical protein